MKTEKNSMIKGTLIEYSTNKHHDIDGMMINEGFSLVNIKFPPHTARYIREVAAEDDTLEIVFHEKPPPPHHKDDKHHKRKCQLLSLTNQRTGKKFDVASVKPPEPAESGRLLTFHIDHPQFTRAGKDNGITGVISEGNFFHLHPEEYEDGEGTLACAKHLLIKAKKRTDRSGFVNHNGHTVYHTHAWEIPVHAKK